MSTTLICHEGRIIIDELGDGKRQLRVDSWNKLEGNVFTSCQTAYPIDLIEQILEVKGITHLCDEIMRDENPAYVQRALELSILGYVDESFFAQKEILDFGCGCGSSTLVLARLFPDAQIVGVDMVDKYVSIARNRAKYYAFSNVAFFVSSASDELPKEIIDSDFVILSAVYEHLLPRERQIVLPLIWSIVRPGGIVFVNQTPYRWFPIENHTTGLPLINYLPDHLAHTVSRKFCKHISEHESWEMLLRRGIRGATSREILSFICKSYNEAPILLEPTRMGFNDRIDLWYKLSGSSRYPTIKRFLKVLFKIIKNISGLELLPSLNIAIKKPNTPL